MNDSQTRWPTSGFYNYYTMIGIALVMISVLLVVVLFMTNLFADNPIPYLGVSYVILALTSLLGMAIVAAGIMIGVRRRRLGIRPRLPLLFRLNLANPHHRLVALIIVAGSMGAVGATAVGSYKSVTYLESDQFCSNACHTVMEPEGVAHENSTHANVECVECHVGGGAGAFAEAKLAGARRLYGAVFNSYSRPIHDVGLQMRPMRALCENCHLPSRWIGFKERTFNYFSGLEDNASRSLRMLVKVGGQKSGLLGGEGIHYHMLLDRKIEFAATDETLEDIAWVRITENDGVQRTYRKPSLDDAELSQLARYEMDCIDCHSRPAHQFRSPANIMNELLANGRVDPKLPYVKKQGTELLAAEYETQDEGATAISESLWSFYRDEYPGTPKEAIGGAVVALQAEYRVNFFPEMGVRWDVYRNQLGHKDSKGCFRCHNDVLTSDDGQKIFTTCSRCHAILSQSAESVLASLEDENGQAFYHLGDDSEIDSEEYNECTDCHMGGAELY